MALLQITSFDLEPGVRQGDPLSPYLFILAVETMAITIRKNVEIRGIKFGGEETKLLQYADEQFLLNNFSSSCTLLNFYDLDF